MKKVLAISSVLFGVVFLAGCGQQQITQTPKVPIVTNSSESNQSISNNSINTKEGYLLAKELTTDQSNIALKSIIIDNGTSELSNKIQYVFSNDKVAIATAYDLLTKEVSILERSDITSETTELVTAKAPAITETMLNFGLEGVLSAVRKNDEFKKWDAIYSEDFKKYLCMTSLNEQNEWEWRIIFFHYDEQNKRTSAIKFSVKPEENLAIILSNSLK